MDRRLHDGVAVQPITGRLVVDGWVLARNGVAGIDIELDGTLLGQAHYGLARPDVAAAFPDWEGGARSGYTFHCPSRALPDGEHVVEALSRARRPANGMSMRSASLSAKPTIRRRRRRSGAASDGSSEMWFWKVCLAN